MNYGTNIAEPNRVRTMFGAIARRYDLANHLLSCGVDFYWRKRAARIVGGWEPRTILDLATGTGDLAIALESALPNGQLTAVDVLPEMVELARRYLAPDRVDRYLDYARSELGEHVAIYLQPQHWISADLGEV